MIRNVDGDPNAASASSDIPGVLAVVNDPLSMGPQIPGFQPGGFAQLHPSILGRS